MSWQAIFTATAGIDEPAEGAELSWAEKELVGEELTVAYDDDWPACPRLALSHGDVARTSLSVTAAATRLEFDVEDYTEEPTVPVPPRAKVYVRGREGRDYDETSLYFNPAHRGKRVVVNYNYYLPAAPFHAFAVAESRLYFCEEGTAKWFGYDGEEVAAAGWLRAGANGASAVATGDGCWALISPGDLLGRYGREFSAYLDVRGVELPGLEYLGLLCQAFGTTAALLPAGEFVFGAPAAVGVVRVPAAAVLSVGAEVAAARDISVELSYRGGRVRAGEGRPTYYYDNRLITSRGHAQIICERLRRRLEEEGACLRLEVTEDYYVAPGALVNLSLGARRGARLYRVVAARRDLVKRSVQLRLVASATATTEVK